MQLSDVVMAELESCSITGYGESNNLNQIIEKERREMSEEVNIYRTDELVVQVHSVLGQSQILKREEKTPIVFEVDRPGTFAVRISTADPQNRLEVLSCHITGADITKSVVTNGHPGYLVAKPARQLHKSLVIRNTDMLDPLQPPLTLSYTEQTVQVRPGVNVCYPRIPSVQLDIDVCVHPQASIFNDDFPVCVPPIDGRSKKIGILSLSIIIRLPEVVESVYQTCLDDFHRRGGDMALFKYHQAIEDSITLGEKITSMEKNALAMRDKIVHRIMHVVGLTRLPEEPCFPFDVTDVMTDLCQLEHTQPNDPLANRLFRAEKGFSWRGVNYMAITDLVAKRV